MRRTGNFFNLAELADALGGGIEIGGVDGVKSPSELPEAELRRAQHLTKSRCESVVLNPEAPDVCSDSDKSPSDGHSDSGESQKSRCVSPVMLFQDYSTPFSMRKNPVTSCGLMGAHDEKGVVYAEKEAKKRLRNNDDAAASTKEAPNTMMKKMCPEQRLQDCSTLFSMRKNPVTSCGLMGAHDEKGVVYAEKEAKKRLRNNDDAAASTKEAPNTMVKKMCPEQRHVRPLSPTELPFPVPMIGQDLMLGDAGNNKETPSPSDITAVLKL